MCKGMQCINLFAELHVALLKNNMSCFLTTLYRFGIFIVKDWSDNSAVIRRQEKHTDHHSPNSKMIALLLLLVPLALASPTDYIVGGSNVNIANFPWQVRKHTQSLKKINKKFTPCAKSLRLLDNLCTENI